MERQNIPRRSLGRVARSLMIPFCVIALVGCGHLDMYDQAKYNPYEQSSAIFAKENGGDGAASRPILPNTQAQGQPLPNDPLVVAKDPSGTYVKNPISVNDGVLARGKERYVIYCYPCHGELGNGKGFAASYFKNAGAEVPSYYDPRLVQAADGYFFEVITNGKNKMYSYASRVLPADRWAITAYIRTLQADPPAGAILPTPAPKPAGAPAATAAPAGTAAPTAAP